MPTVPLATTEKEAASLEIFGHELMRRAEQLVTQRIGLDERWAEDLSQYRGRDAPSVEARLRTKSNRSKVFINITKAKCNAAEARLYEMLFPTDDRNWSLEPTPEPQMDGGEDVDTKQAREKARKMQRRIDDQLTEAGYPAVAREVIHDAVVYGTGILKAPVLYNRFRRKWKKLSDGMRTLRVLSMVPDIRPGVQRVEPWNFYPDLTAPSLDDAEFVFERRYLTRAQVFKLLTLPGYIPDQLKKVLTADRPLRVRPPFTQDQVGHLSDINVSDADNNRYELWEYHGPVPVDVLRMAGVDIKDDEEMLTEMEGIIQFIGPYIIKADLNPLETNDRPYMAFVYEPDELSPFGFGIPALMRHSQRIANASWRLMMENAAMAAHPQTVMNRMAVEPADGDWDIKPGKVWYVTDPAIPANAAFFLAPTELFQQQYLAIYQSIRQIVDDEINLPQIAQGAVQGAPPETASALAMLLQGANAVLKRVVRRFDDGITVPLIQRFYDYNMQYSDDEEIKGDYHVKARGSTALLTRESQLQTIPLVMQAATSPAFAPMTDLKALYKKFLDLMHFNSEDVLLSDEEIQQMMQQGQPPSKEQVLAQIKQMQLQLEAQKHQDMLVDREKNRQLKLQLAQIELQKKMMELATDQNLTLEQIKAQLAATAMKENSKADMQLREAAIKDRYGSGL